VPDIPKKGHVGRGAAGEQSLSLKNGQQRVPFLEQITDI
jgi:hypothetical protein